MTTGVIDDRDPLSTIVNTGTWCHNTPRHRLGIPTSRQSRKVTLPWSVLSPLPLRRPFVAPSDVIDPNVSV